MTKIEETINPPVVANAKLFQKFCSILIIKGIKAAMVVKVVVKIGLILL